MHLFFHKLSRIPVWLFLSIILMNALGIITLFSANNMVIYPLAYKQLVSFLLFLLVSLVISTIDLKAIYRSSYFIYFFSIILLIMIEFFGHRAMGATRWFNLLGLKIQPSEFIKVGLVLFLARYYHNIPSSKLNNFSSIFIPIIITMIPTLIIMKQPDLGTSIIIILTFGIIIFGSGIKIINIFYLLLPVIISIPFGWQMLHQYQKKRILMFINPESDPLGHGYNVIQSKIAIGSGGFYGKGFGLGTQSKLDFLPEHETDFIFPCFSEEFGFIGSLVLIILYFVIIVQSLSIASNSRSVFGKILVLGIVAIFFLHILINIAMVSGLFPVTGKPLPFMSYGRNIVASMLIGLGLVMNVHVHQRENFVKS
jgi:rod shape determining protein RodA